MKSKVNVKFFFKKKRFFQDWVYLKTLDMDISKKFFSFCTYKIDLGVGSNFLDNLGNKRHSSRDTILSGQ